MGYPAPFKVEWVEIGNEDYLNNGRSSYYSYRFMAVYNAIRGKYPNMNIISSINPSPSPDKGSGGMVDLHIYDNIELLVEAVGRIVPPLDNAPKDISAQLPPNDH